jgi:multidrug efflux pump subunit AcrA (membrane-fusion protein)
MGVACVLAASALACGGAAPPADNAILLGPENVAVVSMGQLRSGPVISGTLAPVRDAQIRAQVGGSVVRISADQGQRVAAGQELAQIDATGLSDAYASAKAAVDAAQTAADYAARQSQRYDTLFAAGAVSDRDRETVHESNAQAQAALTDAKARLVSAGKQLAYTAVRAPFAGVISARGLLAPVAAIDARNLRPAVERLAKGRVERVDVTLGLRDTQTNQVQITAGVNAGDTLLVGSAQAISAGTRVRVTAMGDSTTAAR